MNYETNSFLSIIRPNDQLLAVDLVESIWLYVVFRKNIMRYKVYKDTRNSFISMVEGHMCNLHELVTEDMWHNKCNYFWKSRANIIHKYLSTKDIYVIQDMESLLQGLAILHMLLLLVNRQWLGHILRTCYPRHGNLVARSEIFSYVVLASELAMTCLGKHEENTRWWAIKPIIHLKIIIDIVGPNNWLGQSMLMPMTEIEWQVRLGQKQWSQDSWKDLRQSRGRGL